MKINHLINYNTKVWSLGHSALKIVFLSKEVCIVDNSKMAAPVEGRECLIHLYQNKGKTTGRVSNFTEISWDKVKECVAKWISLDGVEREVSE